MIWLHNSFLFYLFIFFINRHTNPSMPLFIQHTRSDKYVTFIIVHMHTHAQRSPGTQCQLSKEIERLMRNRQFSHMSCAERWIKRPF